MLALPNPPANQNQASKKGGPLPRPANPPDHKQPNNKILAKPESKVSTTPLRKTKLSLENSARRHYGFPCTRLAGPEQAPYCKPGDPGGGAGAPPRNQEQYKYRPKDTHVFLRDGHRRFRGSVRPCAAGTRSRKVAREAPQLFCHVFVVHGAAQTPQHRYFPTVLTTM